MIFEVISVAMGVHRKLPKMLKAPLGKIGIETMIVDLKKTAIMHDTEINSARILRKVFKL